MSGLATTSKGEDEMRYKIVIDGKEWKGYDYPLMASIDYHMLKDYLVKIYGQPLQQGDD